MQKSIVCCTLLAYSGCAVKLKTLDQDYSSTVRQVRSDWGATLEKPSMQQTKTAAWNANSAYKFTAHEKHCAEIIDNLMPTIFSATGATSIGSNGFKSLVMVLSDLLPEAPEDLPQIKDVRGYRPQGKIYGQNSDSFTNPDGI